MGSKAKMKGARKAHRDEVLATISDEDKAILKEYRIRMFTVPGKPPENYKYDDAFYVETLGFFLEDWDNLDEEDKTPEPTFEQAWADIKDDIEAPREYTFPHLEEYMGRG